MAYCSPVSSPAGFPHWVPTRESHTFFATLLGELGLLGLMAGVWLLWRILSRSLRERRRMADPYLRAVLIALITVFAMNFLLLRHYIYDGRQGSIPAQLATYTASAGAFRLLEYLAFLVLLGWLDADYRLVVIGVLAVSAVLKFLTYRFIFERRPGDFGAYGA